jgi:hypothetical protein
MLAWAEASIGAGLKALGSLDGFVTCIAWFYEATCFLSQAKNAATSLRLAWRLG